MRDANHLIPVLVLRNERSKERTHARVQFPIRLAPSGHARVCLNTLVYVALLSGDAGERLGVTSARRALALAYLAAQLATVFVSGWAHHPTLDLVLGYACVLPQLALLWCFLPAS